jgi:phosphoadenosine phosphosulfate reductase
LLVNHSIEQVAGIAESWEARDVLAWGFRTYGDALQIASGFGVEGMVLIDIAIRIQRNLRVFTTDTGFLFPETYALMQRVEQRYGIQVERLQPALSPEAQANLHGPSLWRRNADQCCALRKVEPLREKLCTLQAWATAIRREQTPSRAQARKIEGDAKFALVKLNPIADWTSEQVWEYVRQHDVPYNALHDRGYPSISCTHCTRAVLPGEHPRAGRWAGQEKTECGLHVPDPSPLFHIAPAST